MEGLTLPLVACIGATLRCLIRLLRLCVNGSHLRAPTVCLGADSSEADMTVNSVQFREA